MTNPLPSSLIKPPVLDLAEGLGRAMVRASGNVLRMATLERIYSHMTPAAKARCDFARTVATLEA